MCNIAILKNGGTLESVPNQYKTHEMCDKAVDNFTHALKFFSDHYKAQECELNLLIILLLQYYLFLNALRLKNCVNLYLILFPVFIRLKKYVIKLLIIMLMHENLFLIDIRLKKCLIIQFPPECYKTQEMCNKAVNICFFLFDAVPDDVKLKKIVMKQLMIVWQHYNLFGLLQAQCLKSFLILYPLMMIYSLLKTMLVKSLFILMK